MRRIIKEILLKTPASRLVKRAVLKNWERKGKPVPPPHFVKEDVLLAYAARFKAKTLIETGTYWGEMIQAMKPHFDRVVSIELSPYFYERAKRIFRRDKNVELINGDSGKEMGRVVDTLQDRALFWLDGHYSGGATAKGEKETPIFDELAQIFERAAVDHVIVIDDARCFGGDPEYPTLDELKTFVLEKRPNFAFVVEDDIIRIFPSR